MKHELGFWFWFYILMMVNGILAIIVGAKVNRPFSIIFGALLIIVYSVLLWDYKNMD